jgi:hypothetical protein
MLFAIGSDIYYTLLVKRCYVREMSNCSIFNCDKYQGSP